MTKRIDFHIHTFHSDGVMLPSEVIAKTAQMGYQAIAITDHADESNIEELIFNFKTFLKMTPPENLEVLIGVELSYIYPEDVVQLATKARELGAQIILVHGESIVEPHFGDINQAVVDAPEGLIDIIAHPGFLTIEQAQLAAQKGVYIELTSRKGHCLTNGYLAKIAKQTKAKMVINSNAHTSSELITQNHAIEIAKGAGLDEEDIRLVTEINPQELLQRAKKLRQ